MYIVARLPMSARVLSSCPPEPSSLLLDWQTACPGISCSSNFYQTLRDMLNTIPLLSTYILYLGFLPVLAIGIRSLDHGGLTLPPFFFSIFMEAHAPLSRFNGNLHVFVQS